MKYLDRIILVSFISILININAKAQWDPGATLSLGMGHGQTALSQSVMSNTFNNANKGTSKADNVDYVYLGFSHYRGFEDLIFKQVLINDKNTDKGKLRSFLSSTRTMHHFGTRSREYGLKDAYVSDILATGIAWNWEMYHQTKANKQKVMNIRNAIRSNMAKNGVKSKLTKLSDDDKRNWVLSFMYNHSMLAQTIKLTGKITPLQKKQLAQIAAQAGVPNIATISMN